MCVPETANWPLAPLTVQATYICASAMIIEAALSFVGAGIPPHQIVPVLGQLAQQIAIQSAVAQQIGLAVHQLAHQLALQGAGFPGGGIGAGQGFAGAGQPYVGGAAQPFGAQPFGLSTQGGYGGLGPQTQGWGQAWGGRPQTIQ